MAAESQDHHVVAILGCGKMGVAIIRGLIASSNGPPDGSQLAHSPTRLHIKACVRRASSAAQLREKFPPAADSDRAAAAAAAAPVTVDVRTDGNVEAARQADVVILGCKPGALHDVLGAAGMREALAGGKPVISILVGTSADAVGRALDRDADPASAPGCYNIIRAVPNIAATIARSTTPVTVAAPLLPTPSLPAALLARLGWVEPVPAEHASIAAVLCGAGPAYTSLFLEALAEAAVERGVERGAALRMAARMMVGTAEMVLRGEEPGDIREKVCTRGVCRRGGCGCWRRGRG
ncbi:pyrroline-5-carboxylate reductase dimerization-domain-containing protein [Macrophomina phaseolina]|uniref:Pyrroline-5-carboxylate reductase dimerization-domain-containing protein n=1 Tax=Macrophomina phaseolina TaxID=35725 RepID=A0ABQ8GGD8_9PEZI|nr:pyrroline-5-carboxylate reductase dimerization-domain-containing protein [Macrophomina phaseolina]